MDDIIALYEKYIEKRNQCHMELGRQKIREIIEVKA